MGSPHLLGGPTRRRLVYVLIVISIFFGHPPKKIRQNQGGQCSTSMESFYMKQAGMSRNPGN